MGRRDHDDQTGGVRPLLPDAGLRPARQTVTADRGFGPAGFPATTLPKEGWGRRIFFPERCGQQDLASSTGSQGGHD